MAQYDVDLRDYWRVIKKKKAIIILIVFLVGACSYGFAKLKEPEPLYESSSAIKIERITSMADFLMGGFWRQEESLITHAYIIKSFPVLEQTAKELQWLPGNLTTQEIRNSKTYLSAIQRLKSLITAEQEGGTNIINIKVVSNSPDESAHVANAVAQAYRNYNIQEKNKKTFETKAFIEEQLQLNSDQLKQAEEALQAFKEGYALISMDDQARNILDQLFNVEAEYEQVIKEKNQIVSQLRVLRENPDISSKEFDRTLFSPIKKESPIYGLRVKLSELLLKRQTLLVDFTEKHPEVVEVDDQIQAVTDEIKKELSAFFATLKMREASLSKKVSRLRQESQGLPEKALQLVRLQREVASQEALYSQLKAKYQETLIQESGKVEEVTIVKPALVPSSPFNIPSKIMIVVTGFIMGLVIGIVVAFIVEVFDTSMGTIEDVENLLQVPVLGVIPLLAKEEKDYTGKEGIEKVRERDLVTHYDPKSLSAEAFRTLRSNLQFMSPDKKGKSFLITSSFVKEGKTFSVINLSLSIAQAGSKVLLLEADLRKPVIHKTFGLEKMPGLTDCVLGNYQWDEVKNSITDIMLGDFELEEVLQTPGLDNLTIVTAGTQPTNPAEILRSTRFREFLQEAYEKYDMIFLDSPPVLPVADAAELAPLVDDVILVYTVGRIGRGILKRAKMTLDNINATVWGVILNNVRPEMGPDYFKYHTQYYYDSERDDAHKKRSSIKNFFKKYL